MLRVDQLVEMCGVFAAKLLDEGLLLLLVFFVPERIDVLRHFLRYGRIVERHEPCQPLDIAVFLARDVREKFAALDDLADGFIEVDRDPLVLAAFAGALEHLANTIGIIRGLQTGLAFRADAAINIDGVKRRRRFRQMGEQRPWVVGIAIDLGDDAVLDLRFDAAAGVAIEAHRVEAVFRVGKIVRHVRPAIDHHRAGFLSAERARGGGGYERAAEHRAAREEIAAGEVG